MNVIKRTLTSVALGLILSGCAAISETSSPVSGRVAGHVTVRACGGANTENQNGCKPQPAAGVTLAFKDRASALISRATTDSTGAYSIKLSPGSYDVTLRPGGGQGLGRYGGQSKQVIVLPGKTVTADFGYTIQLL